jgi:hypothetical protein
MLAVVAQAAPKFEESIVEGKVQFGEECKGTTAEVFISHTDKTLVYQVEVPRNGTFRFNVPPRKYNLAVKSADCFYRTSSKELKNGEKDFVQIALHSKERNPAIYNDLSAPTILCFQAPCNINGNVSTIPNYVDQSSFPYWGYYGMQYPNFYYPGAWYNGGNNWNTYGGGGLNPYYYTGQGNIAMAKPVLYIDAPEKSKFDVTIKFKDPRITWMTTTPSYENNWNVNVGKNSELQVGDATYSYLFYDYRAFDGELQNTSGFCAEHKEAFNKMKQILKTTGFKPSEIADFENHWMVKLTPAKELCVFPQDEKQLNAMNEVVMKPAPAKIKRILFVVVPKDKSRMIGFGKFTVEPKVAWNAPVNEHNQRQPSSTETFVREWGVAFSFSDKGGPSPKH